MSHICLQRGNNNIKTHNMFNVCHLCLGIMQDLMRFSIYREPGTSGVIENWLRWVGFKLYTFKTLQL